MHAWGKLLIYDYWPWTVTRHSVLTSLPAVQRVQRRVPLSCSSICRTVSVARPASHRCSKSSPGRSTCPLSVHWTFGEQSAGANSTANVTSSPSVTAQSRRPPRISIFGVCPVERRNKRCGCVLTANHFHPTLKIRPCESVALPYYARSFVFSQ